MIEIAYIYYNPNPCGKLVGDCVIRAVSKIQNNDDWYKTYAEITAEGFKLCDMPSSNYVWASYLKSKGFVRKDLPNTCPDCYTLEHFCQDYPKGKYIVATGTHVIAVEDGDIYDSWDSSNEIVNYYWIKEVK